MVEYFSYSFAFDFYAAVFLAIAGLWIYSPPKGVDGSDYIVTCSAAAVICYFCGWVFEEDLE